MESRLFRPNASFFIRIFSCLWLSFAKKIFLVHNCMAINQSIPTCNSMCTIHSSLFEIKPKYIEFHTRTKLNKHLHNITNNVTHLAWQKIVHSTKITRTNIEPTYSWINLPDIMTLWCYTTPLLLSRAAGPMRSHCMWVFFYKILS